MQMHDEFGLIGLKGLRCVTVLLGDDSYWPKTAKSQSYRSRVLDKLKANAVALNSNLLNEELAGADASTFSPNSLLLTLERKKNQGISTPELERELSVAIAAIRRAIISENVFNANFFEDPSFAFRDEADLDFQQSLIKIGLLCTSWGTAFHILSTKLDLCLELAADVLGVRLETNFAGIHLRKFRPSATSKEELPTLAKIRGSISWWKKADAIYELSSLSLWELTRCMITSDLRDASVQANLSSFVLPSDMYLSKEGATLRDSYLSTLKPLERDQKRRPLIICGYDFLDEDINAWIENYGALNGHDIYIIPYPPDSHRIFLTFPRLAKSGGFLAAVRASIECLVAAVTERQD